MKKKSHKEGRSAKSGQYVTIEFAKKHPNSAEIESVPNRGYGTENEKKPKPKPKKGGEIGRGGFGKWI